jgi:glutamate racemase
MIALFDSGYGGLTVLKPIMELLPQYDYLYLGDNARAPYGNHSPENIQKFSEQAVEYLFDRGVKLIIFACNTASAVALRQVQEKYLNGAEETERKILGVLIPVAEEAVKLSKNGRIGVVGTKATISSGVYDREIAKAFAQEESQNRKPTVHSQACPLLVPFIEEDWHEKPEAISILNEYLGPLKDCDVDTLILGCTHYPLMTKHFEEIMGKQTELLESGKVTAQALKRYLDNHPEITSKLSTHPDGNSGTRHFLTTDDPSTFKTFVEKHFAMKIKMPEKVTL